MTQVKSVIFPALFIAFILCSRVGAADQKIQIKFQVFRLINAVEPSDDLNPDDSAWAAGDQALEKLKQDITFFNRGFFDNRKLYVDAAGWKYNNKPIPFDKKAGDILPKNKIQYVCSPVARMTNHNTSNLRIKSDSKYDYLVKRKDGLLELKQIVLPTGMEFIVKAHKENDRQILLKDMCINIDLVDKRERVPGVNLNVGKPIVGNYKYYFPLRLTTGKDYGMLIRTGNGSGRLLVRVRADFVNEPDGK